MAERYQFRTTSDSQDVIIDTELLKFVAGKERSARIRDLIRKGLKQEALEMTHVLEAKPMTSAQVSEFAREWNNMQPQPVTALPDPKPNPATPAPPFISPPARVVSNLDRATQNLLNDTYE